MNKIKLIILTLCCMCVGVTSVCFFGTKGDVSPVFASEPLALNKAIGQMGSPALDGATQINNIVIFVTLKGEESQIANIDTIASEVDGLVNLNNDSLKNYYKALSNGKLTIDTTMATQTRGGTTSYFVYQSDTITRAMCLPLSTENPEGYNSTADRNKKETALMQGALDALDSYANNLPSASELDVNNDGYVDCITLLVLNSGEHYQNVSDNDNLLWPHHWACNYTQPTIKGKKVFEYMLFTNDKMVYSNDTDACSTYAHEMGHQLGFPDLYEASAGTVNYMYTWDLMAQDCMQYMTSYSRSVAGWIDDSQYQQLTTNGTYTLKPVNYDESNILGGKALTKPVVCYYVQDPKYPNQRICFEYRKKSGYFDVALPNSGLLIYRVDTAKGDEVGKYFAGNDYNTTPASVYVFRENGSAYPLAFDGLHAGTSFGIASNQYATVTSGNYITFQSYTDLNSVSYVNSGIVVSGIKTNSDGTISFNIDAPTLQKNPEVKASDFASQTLYEKLLKAVGKSKTEKVYANDFKNLTRLDLSGQNITDLTGLDKVNLASLTYLNLSSNAITNGLSLLSGLTSLETLVMMNCGLTTMDFLPSGLKNLNVACNEIADFSPLTAVTTLEKALLVFNSFDASLPQNADIMTAITKGDSRYYVGIQSVGATTYLGKKYVLYSANNFDSSVTFAISRDNKNITSALSTGYISLESGTYKAVLTVPKGSVFNGEAEYSKSINFKVVDIALKVEYVEIMQGKTYTPDSSASLVGYSGNLNLDIVVTYGEDEVVVDKVDTSIAGVYHVTFTITSDSSADDVVLVKTVKVFGNEYITFGKDEHGNDNDMPDVNLYKALLVLVGKSTSDLGSNDDNKLFVQDFYFYDVNNVGAEPITEITLNSKQISSLKGMELLNLSKVTSINLDNNKITDISPLYNLKNLSELYLYNNKITSIDGIDGMTGLTKLDLSYNAITDISPLKSVTEPFALLESGKEQTLKSVNVMFNMLDMENAKNSWILSNNQTGAMISPYKIFIVLVQGIVDGDVYTWCKNTQATMKSNFTYHQTQANTYIDASAKEAHYYSILLGANEVKWENGRQSIKNGSFTLTAQKNKDFYKSEGIKSNRKVYYVVELSLKDLAPNTNFTTSLLLKADDPSKVLSTEVIMLPDVADVKFSSVAGLSLTDDRKSVEVTFLDNNQGNRFQNGKVGKYQIKYSVSTYNINTGDVSDVTDVYRIIEVVNNAQVRYNPIVTGMNTDTAVGVIDTKLWERLLAILNVEPKEGVNGLGGTFKYINKYDAYGLTSLDLQNLGIEYINGLNELAMPKLTALRLNNNKIKSVAPIGKMPEDMFDNLIVIDLSNNEITDASPLKNFRIKQDSAVIAEGKNSTVYVNVILNKISLSIPTNRFLIDPESYKPNGNYFDYSILVGVQGLDESQDRVTYGASRSQAGFYYFADNIKNAKLVCDAIHTDSLPESAEYVYNQYYYFESAGEHEVKFTANLNVSSVTVSRINFVGTIRHGKVYLSTDVVEVDYSASDNADERQPIIDDSSLVFEGIDASEYTVRSQIPSFTLGRLAEFVQTTNVYLTSDDSQNDTFTKKVLVKDRQAPVIAFTGNNFIIIHKGEPTGLNSKYGVDVEVTVSDNYDPNVQIDVEVRNSADEVVERVDVDKPDVYTVTFKAIDGSGNVADPVSRVIKVIYRPYTVVMFDKPEAKFMTGEIEFFVQLIIAEGEDVNPNPVFYWFVDGEYVDSSLPIESDNEYIIKSSFKYDAKEAGEHTVTLRINNKTGDLSEENSTPYERTYFVLLDKNVVSTVIVVGIGIVVVTVATLITVFALKRRRNNKYQEYENKTYR